MSSCSPKENVFSAQSQCKKLSKMKGWDAIIHRHNHPKGLGTKNLHTKINVEHSGSDPAKHLSIQLLSLQLQETVYTPRASLGHRALLGPDEIDQKPQELTHSSASPCKTQTLLDHHFTQNKNRNRTLTGAKACQFALDIPAANDFFLWRRGNILNQGR